MTLATDPKHHLWEEKYRPAKLDDVIIPQSIKDGLKAQIKDGAVTSMLFFSPSPGTGKTTTAYAVANELDVTPLYINASLDNSIDDIRTKVVQYATTANMFGGAGTKVVILDECERLSTPAQESLKGLIEQVSSNCAFLLTTNTKSRIVEPLVSRCEEIDFIYSTADQTALAAQMLKRVFSILDEEKVTYDKLAVVQVVKKFAPDNRKILKTLQAYAKKHGGIDAGILGMLAGADVESLIAGMKAKKYDDVKAWCFNNFERLGDDFYVKMFKTLEPVVIPQSVPQAVLTLNDYQRYHATVPDRFVHFLSLMTQLMMEITFR